MNEPSNPQPGSWSPQPPRPSVATGGEGPRPSQPTFGGTGSTLGTGEGEVPLARPPAASVSVRTMASDLASLQSTGGTQPRPYTPPPAGGPKPNFSGLPAGQGGLPARPTESSGRVGQAGAMSSPSKPNMPPVPPPPVPPTPGNQPTGAGVPKPIQPRHSRGLLIGSIVVVAIVGLGALGFFVVYPLIAGPAVPEPAPIAPPEPAPAPEPIAPITPEPTSTPITVPTSTVSDTLPVPVHASLFKAPADLTEEVTLADASRAELQRNVPFDTAEVSILRELSVILPAQTPGGSPVPVTLEQFISFAAPSLFDRDTMRAFGNDVTVFTYTDSKGTWPGFAVRAANGTPLAAVQMKVNQALEQATTLKQLFLTNPGTTGVWKSGSTGNVQNRYQTFSLPGAALNYAWTDRTLVIAASYDAFQTALGRIK